MNNSAGKYYLCAVNIPGCRLLNIWHHLPGSPNPIQIIETVQLNVSVFRNRLIMRMCFLQKHIFVNGLQLFFMKRLLSVFVFILLTTALFAQKGGTVRGKVLDAENGEPIAFSTVAVEGTTLGTTTDLDGFYSITNIPAGEYNLLVTYVGYADFRLPVKVSNGSIIYENVQISTGEGVDLETVTVSAAKEMATSTVQISKVVVTPKQIQALPSTSGEADIAQYLTVLPGVINTGDQGGQLYIRGGSPIQNKILLDGMTIYNPFHSIGFFSVFETETIRNVEVLTGGFNSEYGGRLSAIVDITTREGNKKRFGGVASANPFMAKLLVEGPLKKLDDQGGSISYMLTGKTSYIDQTSPALYSYAENAIDTTGGLPYSFRDYYGKVSFSAGNGTRTDLFGFNYNDGVNYSNAAEINWSASGGGATTKLIPPNSNLIIGARAVGSNYQIELDERDNEARTSAIRDFSFQLDFSYFGNNSQVKYGINYTAVRTDFRFKNFLQNVIDIQNNNSEVAAFVNTQFKFGNLIVEPGLRVTGYVKQTTELAVEPRLGAKMNLGENFRIKFAGGLYSQNLVDARNERDIVNLFAGFLAGPESDLFTPGSDDELTEDRIQHAVHAIGGFEIDLSDKLSVNVEPYYKGFTQLIALNRNKVTAAEPDFITETGTAAGIDFSFRYTTERFYGYLGYSLSKVDRNDGVQEFPTNFDRRHNLNFLGTYTFGKDRNWEFGARYNYGTGFPFTRTQTFFSLYRFEDGLNTDITTDNAALGIEYEEQLNQGRLPDYLRVDFSLKHTMTFSDNLSLDITASVTNALNRENIFYFNRVTYERVNQLPTLPSLALALRF